MQTEELDSKNVDPNQPIVLGALLSEISTETRSRRDPEHLYTAASVGAFGAVAWGAAALTTSREPGSLAHPALIAAIGIVVIAIAVIIKIVREHRLYVELRKDEVRVAKLLTVMAGLQEDILPSGLKSSGDGKGYLFSVAIVVVAALSTAGFCIAVWVGL